MPCTFAGIFFVETLSANHQLHCHFKDEDNVLHHLVLTHFQSPNLEDHPFPDAFAAVQSGSVYFIVGTFAVHNRDILLVHPLITYKCLMKMQTISCYRLSIYTAIDLNQIPLTKSIDDLLSPMHLNLHATVRCQTMPEPPQSTSFQHEYPTWKRFIGEIEQYADRENRVIIFLQNHLTL